MIVPMKKVTVIVQSKDVDSTLRALASSGVLHVEHQNVPISEDITSLEQRYSDLGRTIEALTGPTDEAAIHEHPVRLIHEILELLDKQEALKEGIKKIQKDIATWQDWGDFDPELIYNLEERHIWVRLCRISRKEMQNLPDGVILEELFRKGKISYCAIISRKEISLPFEALQLPEQGLSAMQMGLVRERQRLEEIEKKLHELSEYKNALLSYQGHLASLIEFNKVRAGVGGFERLSYLMGYCPAYNLKSLEELAMNERWGFIAEDPLEHDNVPTLIKNPRWIEIIRPVFRMMNTMPGYREVDISLWFLLFFSVFFGILVGDAGYGAIFFIVNLFCHIKFRNRVKNKAMFFLIYVLSVCAIAWGVLTGTFFGQAYLSQRIKPLLPLLREDVNVQAICFLIGALHLSIAHLWRFIRKMPSIKAFSEAGWICMLWVAYFIARSLILGEAFPVNAKWLFAIASALIILCTNPTRNIFKTIGSGIGDLLLHIVNSFTDIVSYIRLFAVGAATVAVADAFNQMASGIGYGNILAGFSTALILLFGHTLNILLAAMAILVHGVRLNVLEFSSHLNMEWSGVEYAPFKHKGD